MPTIPHDACCLTCDKLIRGTPGLDKILVAMGYVYYDQARRRTVIKKHIEYCRCKLKPTQKEMWWMKE